MTRERNATATTVAQLRQELAKMPEEAVVLIESGGGLSRVCALDCIEARDLVRPPR